MRRWLLSLLLVAVVAAGCSDLGHDPDDDGEVPVEPILTVFYATDIQPILDSSCIGCHGNGGQAGLDLRADVSRSNLVGIVSTESPLALVEPQEPDLSWFYLKLIGQHDVGDVMPPGGSIGSAAIDLVRTWIEEGAADN